MWRPTGTGRSNVLASVEAAKWFVDHMPGMVPDADGDHAQVAEDGTMETTVLNRAGAAKADDNRIYTIAIGAPTDTNPVLLAAVATEPGMYVYMPDADELERVYAQIQGSLGCR